MTANRDDEILEARLALLRARYPTAFPEAGMAIARRAIHEAATYEAAIRHVPLDNGDGPAGVFAVVRPHSHVESE